MAQRFELALTGGANVSTNSDFDMSAGWAAQVDYAQRLANGHVAALYVDVPLAFGLQSSGLLPSLSGIEQRDFNSWFFAPGLKLKLAPAFPVSPYVTVGAGVAHFNLDATTSSPAHSVNKGVVQFGGGLDVKVAPFLSLRGEVRDYYSGNPFGGLVSTFTGGGQHNILPMGGVVFRF